MRPNLREAAKRMGYRPMPMNGEAQNHARTWGKPVGYSLFVICDSEQHGIEWVQWFWHAQDAKPILWNRKVYGQDEDWTPMQPCSDGEAHLMHVYGLTLQEYINWIKKCENWDQKAGYAGEGRGAFEFLTLTQTIGGD